MAWILLVLIGVPFALWGIQNYLGSDKEAPAAKVGGREILDRDVSNVYEQSLATLVGVADYDEKQLRRDALEKLIREEVIVQSAEGKSLVVSDAAVRAFLQTLPYFQTNGKFDKEKYRATLAAQNINSNQLAAQIRRALLIENFQKGITDSAFVTKEQVATLLRLRDQEREIEYIKIPLKPSDKVFSDAEIAAYYKDHQQDFRNPEKVSIEYVMVSLEDLAKGIKISDEDLHQFYEEQRSNFGTPERRKVSHILVTADPAKPESDQAALEKSVRIRERLTHGEDFATVAKETSSDTVSAKQGGDLGFIDKTGMEEAFAKAAYALKPGEISEPVKTSFGYHLIKLTELIPAKIKSFEEVENELRKTAQHNAAETKFYELGQSLTEQSYEHPDSLEPAAKKAGLEIQRTGIFTREAGEGLAAEKAIRDAAFSEDVLNGRNSDPVEIGNEKAVVLRVKEHQAASDKPLEAVREAILAKLSDQDARKQTAERSETLLHEVQAGKPLEQVAKAGHLEVVKPKALRRNEEKLPPELVQSVFKAARPSEGKPVPYVVALENGDRIVFDVLAVKDGKAPEGDAKAQEATREFLSQIEGRQEFASFVARLRALADVQTKPES